MRRVLFVLGAISVIVAGGIIAYQYILQKTNKGALQITSNVQANVFINNELVGKTPLCLCGVREDDPERFKDMLTVGQYLLKLEPTDSKLPTYQEEVDIKRNILTVVDRKFEAGASSESFVIHLEKLKDKNSNALVVTSIPTGAQVFLNDIEVGSTSITKIDLPESDHIVSLRKAGYKTKSIRVKITDGYSLNLKANLGIDPNYIKQQEKISSESALLSPTPAIQVSKVLILDTGTGFLRVRQENSLNSQEVGRVTPGQTYDLVQEEADWFMIKIDNNLEGWVSKEFSQITTN